MPIVRWLRQTAAVTSYNLRTIPQRLGPSAVTVVGIAGVVLVVIGVLSIAVGFRNTLASTGDPSTVIVTRAGADSELTSGLGLETTRIISDAPGIAEGDAGTLASAELFVIVDVEKRSAGTEANVPLRGVEPAAFEVRGDLEIVEGRAFRPGTFEIMAGRAASGQFAGLEVGDVKKWGKDTWTVVGIFETGGTLDESEVWTDVEVLQDAYRRGSSFQSVRVRLTDPAAFGTFKDALTSDPRLEVGVERVSEYFAGQSQALTATIIGFGVLLGVLMGAGAVFGALETMYTAVAARAREIATLRALGFGRSPVVISVMAEALALALVGGCVGAGLAFLIFNGYQAATLNYQTFSQVAFAFAVTPPLVLGGILYALAMGFVGGLLPAVRAARLPVASALREL